MTNFFFSKAGVYFAKFCFLAALSLLLSQHAFARKTDVIVIADGVRFANHQVDLGKYLVGSGKTFDLSLRIENNCDAPVVFVAASVSCSCVSISKLPDSLQPNKSAKIRLRVRPALESPTKSVARISKQVNIDYRIDEDKNNRPRRQRLMLQWATVHPVSADPREVRVESLQAGAMIDESVVLSLTDDSDVGSGDQLEIVSVGCTYGFLSAIPDGHAIRIKGLLPEGFTPIRNATLVVHARNGTKHLPELHVPLNLRLKPLDVFVVPSQVAVFNRPIDDEIPVELTFVSRKEPAFVPREVLLLNDNRVRIEGLKFEVVSLPRAVNRIKLKTVVPVVPGNSSWIKVEGNADRAIFVRVLQAFR